MGIPRPHRNHCLTTLMTRYRSQDVQAPASALQQEAALVAAALTDRIHVGCLGGYLGWCLLTKFSVEFRWALVAYKGLRREQIFSRTEPSLGQSKRYRELMMRTCGIVMIRRLTGFRRKLLVKRNRSEVSS